MVNIFNNARAFTPMLTEQVSVAGDTYRASVLSLGYDDPLAEASRDSDRERWAIVLVRHGVGAWMGDKPAVGTQIILPLGHKAKVTKITSITDDYLELEARSVD